KGLAIGYNAILRPNLISTFRYGITRYSRETTGNQTASAVSFRDLDDRFGLSTGLSRRMPLHQLSEDLSWLKGPHTVQFGAVTRFISNRSRSFTRSFHFASTNVTWLRGEGSDLYPRGVSSADTGPFGDAMMALLGIVSEGDANYNFAKDLSPLPVGAPVMRNFPNEEYELYVHDSWRVRKTVVITYGLRWSLMPPVHEADGLQVSTNIPLGDWFNTRGRLADRGLSQEGAGRIAFLSIDDPSARPIYPFYKRNF